MAGRAGAAAAGGTLEYSPRMVLLGDSRSPLTRANEAMPAPPILDAFADTSPRLTAGTRVPARGKLFTMSFMVLRRSKEEISSSPWSRGALAFSIDLPKQRGGHRRVSKTQQLCQQAYRTALRAACKMAGQKRSRRFLEGVRSSFLLQALEGPAVVVHRWISSSLTGQTWLWLWGLQNSGVQDPESREEGEQRRRGPGLQESAQVLQQNDSWDATGSSCEGQRRSGREADVCVQRDEAYHNSPYFFDYA